MFIDWDASWEDWAAYLDGAVMVGVLIFGVACIYGAAYACAFVGAM